MNVAVLTLTRDRLEYTQHCFEKLHEKAGYGFGHYVLDNGSTDGTLEWLIEEYQPHCLLRLPENVGIAVGLNMLIHRVVLPLQRYDLLVKIDNDCELQSDGVLREMVGIYENWPEPMVLSPKVNGLRTQIPRQSQAVMNGHPVGLTQIVGGLLRCVPASLAVQYFFDETLPMAWGHDGHFAKWLRDHRVLIGYVEDLEVNHYESTDGQEKRYPDYFHRKTRVEEKRPYVAK